MRSCSAVPAIVIDAWDDVVIGAGATIGMTGLAPTYLAPIE